MPAITRIKYDDTRALVRNISQAVAGIGVIRIHPGPAHGADPGAVPDRPLDKFRMTAAPLDKAKAQKFADRTLATLQDGAIALMWHRAPYPLVRRHPDLTGGTALMLAATHNVFRSET